MARALPAAVDRRHYLSEVWEELKKVLWPTRTELTRMTGVVIATVFIFAGIIGVADYGLGLVVKQLYAAPGTAARTPGHQLPVPANPVRPNPARPSLPAAPRVSTAPAPATSGAAAPAPSGNP